MNRQKKESLPPALIPLAIGIVLSVLTLLLRLDRQFADFFYNAETRSWAWSGLLVERLIYKLSPVPAFLMFGGGALAALASIRVERLRSWRRTGLCFALCMLLGPGLVVNGVFKEFYGRPRPKQTTEYGGSMEFRPVWVVGIPRKAKSFPCGHASIGFFFMAGYFVWYKRNRKTAHAWLVFGLLYGSVIGLARMAKGGHWFSDVVWSAVFVYYTSYLSAWICGLLKPRENTLAQVD
jgi:membrane-associated PAP2 superfamily phosphatase